MTVRLSAVSKPTETRHKYSKRSAIKAQQPVKEVTLSWYAEQEIYDRMYEAEVWKNGHFFGYSSRVAQHWHSSEQAKAAAEAPLSTETKRKLYRLLDELN